MELPKRGASFTHPGTVAIENYLKIATAFGFIPNSRATATVAYQPRASTLVEATNVRGHAGRESYGHGGEGYQNDLTDSQVIERLLRSITEPSNLVNQIEKEHKTDDQHERGEGKSGLVGSFKRPPHISPEGIVNLIRLEQR